MSKFAGTTLQGSLTASDAAAGVFSLENTYGTDLIVRRVTLDVTTAATSTPNCELDIGTAATAILSDNLIDGVNVNSTGLFDNYGDSGTNGKFKQKWVSGEFLTASMSAGATAALVGTYLVEVIDMN